MKWKLQKLEGKLVYLHDSKEENNWVKLNVYTRLWKADFINLRENVGSIISHDTLGR